MKKIIINGKIITPSEILNDSFLVIEEGKIAGIICNKAINNFNDYEIIDASGEYIAPGFIEIHTHGAGGHDYMDGTLKAFIEASKTHMKHGVTSIVPTTLTSDMETLYRTFKTFRQAQKKMKGGPNILGLHLEGPYFSHAQKGAQDEKYIKNPIKDEYEKIIEDFPEVIRWSIAPEKEGALNMGRYLSKKGVLASVAHTDATCEQIEKAFENGFKLMTHFYSGMSGVKRINAYRVAGTIEAGYLLDDMYVEVIADGKHLPKELLRLIYKIKGPDRICLVTDSMRAAGQNVSETILGGLKGGMKVIVEDGVAKLKDRSAFAGSVATADLLIRNMMNLGGASLREAVNMMSINPAKILNINNKKGSLEFGKDADIIIFDKNININKVFVCGEPTYMRV